MALLFIPRRLREFRPQLFFPFLVQSKTVHSAPVLPLRRKLFSLCSTFHQTLLVSYSTPLLAHYFSTVQSLSTQTTDYPFEFIGSPIRTSDPQEPALVDLLKRVACFDSEAEAIASLDDSGIKANLGLICAVIWALREEWRLAFLAFKWGEKWGCTGEQAYELMVWILGCHRKFNLSWCLIRDLYHSSMDTRRAMFIMIDRYAAANDPCNSIRTFHIIEKFRMTPDEEAFSILLKTLCKHGNIEEAEELMLVNKKLFPLQTEGFNIILNGWCNISVDVLEAKRVWREMSKCCITPNATSYTLMISCFSKVGNLFDSLRLYDEMKKRGWVPGSEVYNSLVYVLARENCLSETHNILEKMKETGLQPDSTTYNSMIRPLCEAKKIEEARNIQSTMILENISPTIETYTAFLEVVDFEETLTVLNHMRVAGLGPTGDTFLLIIAKFLKEEQPELGLKIWEEMKQFEVMPESTHYIALVQGLATFGWLPKARALYAEMRSNGFLDDPKLKKLLDEPVRGSGNKSEGCMREVKKGKQVNLRKGRKDQNQAKRKKKKKT